MDFYATLGTSCAGRETIAALFRAGMTGARLNLSHTTLRECFSPPPERQERTPS